MTENRSELVRKLGGKGYRAFEKHKRDRLELPYEMMTAEQQEEVLLEAAKRGDREVSQVIVGGGPPESMENESGCTDAANARRLVAREGNSLRWVGEWNAWLVWNGGRWSRDNGIQAQAKAAASAARLWNEVGEVAQTKKDAWRTKQMVPWAKYANSARGIAASLTLARSEVGIAISAARLDTDPWLLNVPNGTLDLRTGELREHCRYDLLTKMCPTPYERDAACPTWMRCLNEWLGNGSLPGYLQRLTGYGLTGDVREQLLAILWGEGSNGKSTFVSAVQNVLGGEYGGTPPRSLFVSSKWDKHPAELMTLQGKRLMIAQETDAGAQLAEALIKSLTGGDLITARGMYENFQSFQPTHKLWLCTNHKPEVRGTEFAVWRRLKLIPFTVRFEGGRMDTGLADKLKAEAPGILAWMVRGCLDWQRDGMQEPEVVQMATKSYSQEQDVVGRFLSDCCELNADAETPAADLWEAFRREYPDAEKTQTAFGTELGKRGFQSGHVTSGAHKGRKTWKGLRLLNAMPFTVTKKTIETHRKTPEAREPGRNGAGAPPSLARRVGTLLKKNPGESVEG